MDQKPLLYYWLALSRIPGVGNVLYKRLISAFGTPEKVFQRSADELRSIEGIRAGTIEGIVGFKGDDWAEKELQSVQKRGIRLITQMDDDYPALLKTIYDPPPLLYMRGNIIKADTNALAVVGSRNASSYGRETTKRLAQGLARYGFTIVSGLARGIDTTAHRGALEAGGRTLAVLGSGIDKVYPWENRRLGEDIVHAGAILSEFPLGTAPEACHFPARNRIISGLSLGVVIIEASFRSGSLITARLALEQGREVFAVPGNINSPSSTGTNRLIKEGAKLVTDPEDIIEEFFIQAEDVTLTPERSCTSSPAEQIGAEDKKVLDLLESNPIHIDELIHKSGLSTGIMAGLLLDLELKGLIIQLPGKIFKRS